MKWALYENAAFAKQGWVATNEPQRLDAEWKSLAAPEAVVIANVAGHAVGTYLKFACVRWGLSPTWVKGQVQQCGVSNAYDDPEQLGPDRWAALIGAHVSVPGNCVVVCMGTATTIDALTDNGVFLGGMILPGLDMMHSSLASKTARLGSKRGEVVPFPRSTPDAITTGAARATCGAIEHMLGEMQQAGHDDVSVIATGGAAPLLAAVSGFPIVMNDTLVLQGLVRIGEETMTRRGSS
ncbi:MAG: type III pantothenate kinase [Betaproteobacteria bacterium]|nr:MAG: type III pantothenate kinase [Betaproteobacteria bacterium]